MHASQLLERFLLSLHMVLVGNEGKVLFHLLATDADDLATVFVMDHRLPGCE
jgi:hypothetical protein